MNGMQEELALLKKQYDEARLAILDKHQGRGVQLPLAVPKAKAVEAPAESKRKRFAAEDVEQALARVIEHIRAKGPLGKEKLRGELGMDKKLLDRAAALGVESDQLSIVGERRAAKYVVPSAGQRAGRVKKK